VTSDLGEAEAQAMAGLALAQWGGTRQTPRLVKNRENVVFEALLTGGENVALRLHRPGYQSRAGIESELGWTARLAAAGFGVPRPVATASGGLTAVAGGRVASCVGWLEGELIGDSATPLAGSAAEQGALFHDLGALIGGLHVATDATGLPEPFDRPAWDERGLLGDEPLWGKFWENPALSDDERALILEVRGQAARELADLRAGGADYGAIHADVMRENVLRRDGGLALIDFDDSGRGFRLYDLGTALVQSLEEPNLPLLAASLLAGYRTRRPLGAADAALLPLFVLLRCLASAGWIMTRAAPGDARRRHYVERALRLGRHYLAGTAPWQGAESRV